MFIGIRRFARIRGQCTVERTPTNRPHATLKPSIIQTANRFALMAVCA